MRHRNTLFCSLSSPAVMGHWAETDREDGSPSVPTWRILLQFLGDQMVDVFKTKLSELRQPPLLCTGL